MGLNSGSGPMDEDIHVVVLTEEDFDEVLREALELFYRALEDLNG
jgi:hypothetical protein